MDDTRNLRLRILYTINSSPQYILARSHAPVPVCLILSDCKVEPDCLEAEEWPALYATVSLKKCLDAICQSSPELLQDSTRDFSVYVLDPLESNSAPAPVNISSSSPGTSASARDVEHPRGVAVGLGLMSWALQTDQSDAVTVVGTLIKSGTRQEALEVIFALRETAAMKKASLPGCSSWASSMPIGSVSRSFQPPASKVDQGSRISTSNAGATVTQPRSQSKQPHSASATDASSVASTSASQTPHLSAEPSSSKSMPPPAPPLSAMSAETLATLSAIHMRTKSKQKPKKMIRTSSVPATESDKLLKGPEIFTGSTKKIGRPKGSGTEGKARADSESGEEPKEEIIIIDDNSDGNSSSEKLQSSKADDREIAPCPAPDSKPKARKKRKKPDKNISPFSTTPLIRPTLPSLPVPPAPNPAPSAETQPEPTLLDLLAFISVSSSSDPNPQNAALLAALSSIDSSTSTQAETNPPSATGSTANPALIFALRQLLSVCSDATDASQSQGNAQLPANPTSHQSSHSHDDDIILLDKENVNPTAFKRRTDKEQENEKPSGPSSSSIGLGAPFTASNADLSTQNRGLRTRAQESSPPSTSASVTAANQGIGRKRTLSDFMDERESRESSKGKEKSRGRPREERKDGHRYRHSSSSENGMRHYSRLMEYTQPRSSQEGNSSYYQTGFEAWTSPRRSVRANENEAAGGSSRKRPNIAPDSPTPARVSVSSPVRPSAASILSRKKYVVPEWARTSTAMRPRLSEEAQRALDEAEEKRRREKRDARRKTVTTIVNYQRPKKDKEATNGRKAKPSCAQDENAASTSTKPPADTRRPIAASSDFPLFAISDRPPSSPKPSSSSIPAMPKTPTRDRNRTFRTPVESESLFTPITSSAGPRPLGSESSPLFSPYVSFPTPSPLTSHKKAKMSPIQSVITGQGILGGGGWISGKAALDTERLPQDDEDEEDLEAALDQELGRAFEDEELSCPPSSLPIASSDFDVDESIPRESTDASTQDQGSDSDSDDEDQQLHTTKQHWAGLPPSSPPPPSSPALVAHEPESDFQTDDEMEDLELPIATSDVETEDCILNTEVSSPEDSLAYSEGRPDLAKTLTSVFSAADMQGAGSKMSMSEMDMFEQFTNFNDQSSDRPQEVSNTNTNMDLDAVFQNGLEGMDFSEFWETFKPLVQDHTTVHAGPSTTGSQYDMQFNFDNIDYSVLGSDGQLDHKKLAEDVHALFSGCLM